MAKYKKAVHGLALMAATDAAKQREVADPMDGVLACASVDLGGATAVALVMILPGEYGQVDALAELRDRLDRRVDLLTRGGMN